MSEGQLVWLVAMIAALVLWGAGFRNYRLGSRKTLGIAMIWIGIFAVVALVFGMIQ